MYTNNCYCFNPNVNTYPYGYGFNYPNNFGYNNSGVNNAFGPFYSYHNPWIQKKGNCPDSYDYQPSGSCPADAVTSVISNPVPCKDEKQRSSDNFAVPKDGNYRITVIPDQRDPYGTNIQFQIMHEKGGGQADKKVADGKTFYNGLTVNLGSDNMNYYISTPAAYGRPFKVCFTKV